MKNRPLMVTIILLLLSFPVLLHCCNDNCVAGPPPPNSPYFGVYLPSRVDSNFGAMVHWVEIDGYVDCEIHGTKPPGTKVEIKLVLEIEGVNPLSFMGIFEKGKIERLDYEFSFQLDGALPGGSIVPFTLSGTWSYLPPNEGSGVIGSFESSVRISRFVDLQMGITEWDDEIEIFIDQWYDFDIQIYNAGNIDCRFSVWVFDVPDNMQVEIESDQLYLQAFEYTLLECRIKQFGGYPAEETFSMKALTHPNMDVRYEETFDFRVQSMRGEENRERTSVVIPVAVGSGFVLFFFLIMVIFLLKIRSINSKREVHNYHLRTREGGNSPPPEGPYT
ncbi:MAG: hypothetical protein ACMUHB_03175 [Thermoplasmatota archaeon]